MLKIKDTRKEREKYFMILEEIIKYLFDNLEEEPRIKEIVLNPNFTGVLIDNDEIGVTMNIREGAQFNRELFENLKYKLINKNGLEAVDYLHSFTGKKNYLLNSIKIALINALSQPFMSRKFLEKKGYHVQIKKVSGYNRIIKKDEIVVIIGFSGQCRNIARKAKKVYITELYPEKFTSIVINQEGVKKAPTHMKVIPAQEAEPYLKEADKVLLTGCTLVTDTMEEILRQCSNSKTIVYGCSAGFYPESLFKRGVDTISLKKVKDAYLMLDLLKNCSIMVERFFPSACEEMIIKR